MNERPNAERPPSDDELTTDVDPAWLDAVLDRHRGDVRSLTSDPPNDAETTISPDDELTVEADAGLIDLARRAADAHREGDPRPAPPSPGDDPDDLATPPRGVAVVPPAPPPPPPPMSLPPAPPAASSTPPPPMSPPAPGTHTAPSAPLDPAASTPRWQPTDRLRASSVVSESETLVVPSASGTGIDRTKVAVAAIVAVVVLGVVWLLSSGGDSDQPDTTVPATGVETTPSDSVAVTEELGS